MKKKWLVLGLSLFLVGCSNSDNRTANSKAEKQASVGQSNTQESTIESSEPKRIVYDGNVDSPELQGVIDKIGNDNIEIFYNKEPGFFNFSEYPDLLNETIYGEGAEGIGFALSGDKDKERAYTITIIRLNDKDVYQELKERHNNPEQDNFDKKLVLPGDFEFNGTDMIYLSVQRFKEFDENDKKDVEKIKEIVKNQD